VHGPPPKLPAPSDESPTDPVGVLAVPADVSVTVTEHIACCPTAAGLGEQPTVVFAERKSTPNEALPLLGEWTESPP